MRDDPLLDGDMLRCSLVATYVLGVDVDVVEIDPDAKPQACDR
jgi:hypothetical protein